jgi:hypothetical protein
LKGGTELVVASPGTVVVALGRLVAVFEGVNENGVLLTPADVVVVVEGTAGVVPVKENNEVGLAVDEVTAETVGC